MSPDRPAATPRPTRRGLLRTSGALGLASLSGCLGSTPLGSGRSGDAGAGSGTVGSDGATLAVPAAEGTLPFAPPVTLDGSGRGSVGSIDVESATGTVEIGSRAVSAVVYRKIPWQAQTGRTLYQTLAVAPDALYVLWFYCDDAGSIREVWLTGTDGTRMHEESAGGRYELGASAEISASFPALELTTPATVAGYRIDGDRFTLDERGRGTVAFGDNPATAFDGTEYAVYAFDDVDCTNRCGGAGWYELHCLFWNAERRVLAFGVAYLNRGRDAISVSYLLALPDLIEPGQQQFDAEWSAP